MHRLAAALCAVVLALPAAAADTPLKILTPGYGQAALQDLEPIIEAHIGGPVDIEIVGTGGIPERILKGDKIDLVVTYRESLADAQAKGRIQAQTDVAISNVAIGVPDTSPVPVLKTNADVAAFLKSVPSFGRSTSLSGQHMAAVIEKLGLTAEMKSKVDSSAPPAARIAKGELAAGAQQISELKLAGLKNIVPLPDSLQTDLVLTAATVQGSAHSEDAKKITALLASPGAAKSFVKAGLKPIAPR